jgi:flagellar protein FlaF
MTLETPMYEFSYNEVVDDSRQVMRARERSAMDRVIAMLRAARDKGENSREAIEAIFYLRRLWAIFLDDLRSPENELPEQLRAGIVSIGIWMNKEIDRFRAGQTKDLTPIIEINEIIRDGLK